MSTTLSDNDFTKNFDLIYPNYNKLPWYMKPKEEYINNIKNIMALDDINFDDLKNFNKLLLNIDNIKNINDINDINKYKLGNIINICCYFYFNSNFSKYLDIIFKIEEILRIDIPFEKRKYIYNYYLHDSKRKNKTKYLKCNCEKHKWDPLCESNTLNCEYCNFKPLPVGRVIDTYSLLNKTFNNIAIGIFNSDGKIYFAVDMSNNIRSNPKMIYIDGEENIKKFTIYVKFISDIFNMEWDKSIISIFLFDTSFKILLQVILYLKIEIKIKILKILILKNKKKLEN